LRAGKEEEDMPSFRDLTRRDFMRRSAAGFAGLGFLLNGKWVPLEASQVLPKPANPADRVGVGFIGAGIRGHILMDAAKQTGLANLVVASDCYQGHLDRAKERTDGKIETNYAQYKKVLERKDVEAVVIATPDHWHLTIVLDALSAGKDVYIEKPMTRLVEEGPKIIEAAKRYNRVVQVGSQGRTSVLQKKARELVASGQIGKVTKIVASYNRNSSTGAWNYPIPLDLKNGVNFNWEEWLGPAPQHAYDAERVFRYRKYWDYSGGISTDLFVHLITSIHFIMDAKVPASVVASGGILYRKDGREVPDTLDALFEYPEGFNVNMGSTFNNASTPEQGMVFLGTQGSLTLLGGSLSVAAENPREGYKYSIDSWPLKLQEEFMSQDNHREEANPPLRVEGTVSYRAEGPDATALHMAEFFECVRSRQQCSENAQVGHYAAAAGHMVNLSYRSGKKMFWDAASGTLKF
jgi:predicted dehydrogenase